MSSFRLLSFFLFLAYTPRGSFAEAPDNLAAVGPWRGQVLERGTLRPLALANVFILPEGLKVTTDQDGQFSFEQVPIETRDIVVTLTGYQRFKQTIDLSKRPQRLLLEKSSYVAFETKVIGRKDRKDASKATLSKEEFLKAPGSFGDPIRAVENLTGVVQSPLADVAIQGSPAEDTRYLINGHEIPFIFHFGGLNSVLLPESVDSVDFYSAGFGPEFGRASSGVINLVTKPPDQYRHGQMAFVDFLSSGGFAQGPASKNSSYFVGGRYSYAGEVIKAVSKSITPDDDEAGPPTFNTAPTYFDVNLQYYHQIHDKLQFTFLGIASQDRVDLIIEEPGDPTFSGGVDGLTEFFRLIPQLTLDLGKDEQLSASVGLGVDRQRFQPGNQSLNDVREQVTARAEWRKKAWSFLETSVGIDHLYQDYSLDARLSSSFFSRSEVRVPQSVSGLLIARAEASDFRQGYYWRNDLSFGSRKQWVFSPSLRADHFGLHESTQLQPRLTLRFKESEFASWFVQTGIYSQPIDPRLLDRQLGNPDLSPTYSRHYALRFDRDFRDGQAQGWQVRGGVFYKDLRDIVIDSPEFIDRGRGLEARRFANEGSGFAQGAESLLQYRTQDIAVNLGYTFTDSRRRDRGGAEYRSAQDQTHNANLTGIYNYKNWSFASRFRYVSGNPFTPVVGGVYFENADVYLPIPGGRFSERFEDFWQLDVRVDRKWIYDSWILSLYVDVQNITNKSNELGREYSFNFQQSGAVMGLPILPTFGVKGEF